MQHTRGRTRRRTRALGALSCAVLAVVIVPTAAAAPGSAGQLDLATCAQTIRVSVSSSGEQANGPSERPTVSGDGTKVVFMSHATNLVRGDTNNASDIFLRDLLRNTTTRISVSSRGEQANGGSAIDTRISTNGRYVVFSSEASNLVPGDTNGKVDVFVRDLVRGTTTRVSVNSKGEQANGDSMRPTLDNSGRYIAYTSVASNLDAHDTNGTWDVYLYDQVNRTTKRISVLPDGTEPNGASDGPQVSPDGAYVGFFSLATNLVSGDVDDFLDVFRADLATGAVTLISRNRTGGANDDLSVGGISSQDNRFVSFASHATNLTAQSPQGHDSHPYVLDTSTDTIQILDIGAEGQTGNSGGFWSAITLDGKKVTFTSASDNIVPNDLNAGRDVFIRDLVHQTTSRVSVAADGSEGNDASYFGYANANASIIGFMSFASNLVPGDTNGVVDVFVRISR